MKSAGCLGVAVHGDAVHRLGAEREHAKGEEREGTDGGGQARHDIPKISLRRAASDDWAVFITC